MKKTITAHASRLITAVLIALVMIAALSVTAFADGLQGAPQRDDMQMGQPPMGGCPQGGFGQDQQMGDPQGGFGQNDGQQPPEKPEGDEDRTPPADGENGFGQNGPMGRGGDDPMNRIISAVNELEDESVKSDLEALMQAHLEAMEAERNAEDDDARGEAAEAVAAAREALNQALTDAGIEGMGVPAEDQEPPEKPDGEEDRTPPADGRQNQGGQQLPEKPEGDASATAQNLPEDEQGMLRLFQQFLEWLRGNTAA